MANSGGDLTVEILTQIRDGIRSTNERLDATRTDLSSRIDAVRTELSGQLDSTNERLERLERRQTETEIRLATELTAVAGAVRELTDSLREERKLGKVLADHEARIASLERRTG